MIRAVTAVVLASFGAGACAHARVDHQSERAALMQKSRAWSASAASGDLDRIVSFWADDAVVYAPDAPPIVGKAAIRAYVMQSGAIPGFSISWEPESAELSADGTMGYLLERNRITFKDASGALQTQHNKVVTVWRKEANGEWKCVVDVWNALPATSSGLSLRDVTGHWRVRALAADRDSVLTTYQLWTSEDPAQWRLKFDNRADTIAVRVVAVAGDSIRIQAGPYPSALRPDVTVTTRTTLRLVDGRLRGRSVARYSVPAADSIVVRTEGVRATP